MQLYTSTSVSFAQISNYVLLVKELQFFVIYGGNTSLFDVCVLRFYCLTD